MNLRIFANCPLLQAGVRRGRHASKAASTFTTSCTSATATRASTSTPTDTTVLVRDGPNKLLYCIQGVYFAQCKKSQMRLGFSKIFPPVDYCHPLS